MCKSNLFSRAYMFLSEAYNNGEFGTEGTAAAKKGLNIVPEPLYFRRELTGVLQELLKSTDKEIVGQHPLKNNNKLSANQFMVLYGITVYTNNNNTDPAPEPQDVNYSVPTAPAILNGEIEIEVNDKLIAKVPVRRIVQAQEKSELGFYDLEGVMKLIKPEETIKINFRGAEGVALPANQNNIEIAFHGIRTQ